MHTYHPNRLISSITLALSILLGCLISTGSCWAYSSAKAVDANKSDLPQAQPSVTAKQLGRILAGRWQVVGSSRSGKKLTDTKLMVYQVADHNFLAIGYKADMFSGLDNKKIKTRKRKAFMMLYFEKNDRFNILSFQKSGFIKHYQGKLSRRKNRYKLAMDPITMGPLTGQAVIEVKPINKDRYAEDFYLNIMAPGSKKVLKQKFFMHLIASRIKHWKKHQAGTKK